jgi:hypothetical protein
MATFNGCAQILHESPLAPSTTFRLAGLRPASLRREGARERAITVRDLHSVVLLAILPLEAHSVSAHAQRSGEEMPNAQSKQDGKVPDRPETTEHMAESGCASIRLPLRWRCVALLVGAAASWATNANCESAQHFRLRRLFRRCLLLSCVRTS